MVDKFKTIIYSIPSNVGHLGTVKSAIEKIKETHNDVIIHEGILIHIESLFSPVNAEDKCLLIYDDMYGELINNRAFSHLCTFGSRHHNCSMIVTSQNIFESARYALTVRRQFQYYCVYFPSSERQMLMTLGRTLYPSNPSIFMNCFRQLFHYIKNPHDQYLLIDVNAKSKLPLSLRIRTNFFSEEPYFFITEI